MSFLFRRSNLDGLAGLIALAAALLLAMLPVGSFAQEPASAASRRQEAVRRLEALPGAEKLHRAAELVDLTAPSDTGMRVIVSVQTPNRRAIASADWSTDSGREQWRREVAEAQFTVLDAVTSGGCEVLSIYENFPTFSARVNEQALAALLADPRVEAIEPDGLVHKVMAQSLPVMNAQTTLFHNRGGGLTIAIIDDGVDYFHPDLGGAAIPNGKVIMGIDYGYSNGTGSDTNPRSSLNPHGTAVAGIAAGNPASGLDAGNYTSGVAPDAKIAAVKVFGDGGDSALVSNVLRGINWCITNQNAQPGFPIRVINMSLAGGSYTSVSSCESGNASYRNSINAANSAGITVIASSGNDGFCNALSAPACLTNTISVGAVYDAALGSLSTCVSTASCFPTGSGISCPSGTKAVSESTAAKKAIMFSNTASFLDVLAPGAFIATTDIISTSGYSTTNYYSAFSGTSAAAPFAAGAAAVLQSTSLARTGAPLTPSQLRTLLTSTGDLITDNKGGGLAIGVTKPLINLRAALEQIPASFPFTEGFETTQLPEYWKITGAGRTQLTNTFGPSAGNTHLIMDSTSASFARNEVTLLINLQGRSGVYLRFSAKDFNDEPHAPPSNPFITGADFDGVAVSADGTTWYEIQELRTSIGGAYSQYIIDLDSAIAQHALSYNSAFRIRFNRYGSGSVPNDGIAIDSVSLTTTPPPLPMKSVWMVK